MLKAPVVATVKGLIFIIDPEWEKGIYRRLTHLKTGAQIRSLRTEIYNHDRQASKGMTETIVYTYYQFADGKTEMAKGYVADVGQQTRKLYCECGVGYNWLPALRPGQLGGGKTMCEECEERFERERPMSAEDEYEAVERYLEYREYSDEY